MTYNLTCGMCLGITEVESDTPQRQWRCEHCGEESDTSLPTDGEGNLI